MMPFSISPCPDIHLVDGGITDNLGIRSLYGRVESTGGAREVAKNLEHSPKYVVVIIVNEATNLESPIDSSRIRLQPHK